MKVKLRSYATGYGKYVILAPLFITLEVLGELLLPRIMAGIVDEGISGGRTDLIFQYGLLMVVLALVCMCLGVASARFASIAGHGVGGNIREALFTHMQDFSFADIDRFSSASLVTRLTNDVNNLQITVIMGLRMMTRSPVQLIAALAIAISISPRLALVLAVVIPCMLVLIVLLMGTCMRLFKRLQQRIDGLNGTVQENLVAIRVVKAFVRSAHEKMKFKKANDALTAASLSVSMRMVLLAPIMTITLNFAIIGVLYFGSDMYLAGTLSIGDLSSFLTYIMQILMSVIMVAVSLIQFTRAQASFQRITEVLETTPSIMDGDLKEADLPPATGRVTFRDVHFKYESGNGDDVLSGIDFSIQPGQMVALVGSTGTGKSSLVNLIPRFYDVTGGQVLVDGIDVRDYPVEALRSRIGMVLQQNVLFTGTIRENLLWGNQSADDDTLLQAAKDAQAYDFIMTQPQGLDTLLDQGGVNLSGGQKQRLCIARAMLRHPSILIMDDSTSAVDSATEAHIRTALRERWSETTVVLIAQRISSVRYADQIIVLDDGKIVGTGTHDQLMATCAVYQEIYDSQQEGVTE